MKEFKIEKAPFIHTNETYKKTLTSYIIVFIPYLIYTIYMNRNIKTIFFLLLPLLLTLMLETIYKIIFIKNQTLKTYLKENFSIFSILFYPFLLNINTNITLIILSILIAYIPYKILLKKNYSLTILSYTVLIILLLITKKLELLNYNQQTNIINMLLNGSNLMSPLITILSFLYLSIKKDIKKEITLTSIITILLITTTTGLINKNFTYPIYFILTGGTLFITTILANDFYSPATKTGKILYGLFIGLTITIFRTISIYNILPLSILLASTFTFTFDYINEFINKKITYIVSIILIIITIIITI